MDAASLDPRLRDATQSSSSSGPASTAALTRGTAVPSPDGGTSRPHQQHRLLQTPDAQAHVHSRPSSAQHHPQSQPPVSPDLDVSTSFSPESQSSATPTPTATTNDGGIPGLHQALGDGGVIDPNNPDAKKPRACESCRSLKVRCEPDNANPDGPCRRCAKAGRACVVTQPTRKRQKKTDSRVAELEKKIDALTASLQARGGSAADARGTGPGAAAGTSNSIGVVQSMSPSTTRDDGGGSLSASGGLPSVLSSREWAPGARESPMSSAPTQTPPQAQGGFGGMDLDTKVYPPPIVMAGQKRKYTETRESAGDDVRDAPTPNTRPPISPMNDYSDIVDRGILSMTLATELFSRYTEQMAPHLPGVVFPAGTTASEVRKTKPTLFLSIMTSASSEIPNLQRILNKELMQVIAETAIVTGRKSIELIQAIQLAVIWYWPPEHYEELKFYLLVHVASVMAIDIGLGRKKQNPGGFKKHIPQSWPDHPFRRNPPPDPTTIEARRAWLTCYFLATNTSMALHRPNLIRWSPFMTECVDVLESSPDAAPTDRYLCHLVWTHKLAEEVGIQFSIDEPTSHINLSDQRTQYTLRAFERDLEKYSSAVPDDLRQPSLRLGFHVLNLYMHEIATQAEFMDGGKEQPPQTADSVRDGFTTDGSTLTAAHINAISACLTAIDGIFEVFLSLDVQTIRTLPVFNFVRVAYAVVILIKMYFAAYSSKSELGKVINKDNMKVERHLEDLLEKFRATAVDDKSRPAAKFLVVLVMLRSWFQRQKQGGGPAAPPGTCASTKEAQVPYATPDSSYQARRGLSENASSQPRPPTEYSTTANTPLQLLSEIATNANSGAASASGGSGEMAPGATWLLRPQPPQPFMYDGGADAATSGTGTGASVTPDAATSANTCAAAGNGQMAVGPAMPWMPGAGFGAGDFDYASLGDGFAQAMDMTLADLTEGGYGSGLENSMRYVMQDPPWVTMSMTGMAMNPLGMGPGGFPGMGTGSGGAEGGGSGGGSGGGMGPGYPY